MDDDEYVWVQPQDYDAESRCRDLQRQVRELQAAQMRWEIHRMDLEMQLMTERSARHHDLHAVEDELHREKQAVRLLAHEQAKQAALVTDLRAQLLPHTRHKRKMVYLKKELREKFLAFRLQRSLAMATRCGDSSLLDLLKREVPKMKVDSGDQYMFL